jgi:hypothetical protein
MLGSVGVVLGLIFLAGGAWIWLNVEGYMGLRGWLQYYEYSGYSMPLLIVGVFLFVVGFAFFSRAGTHEEKKLEVIPKPPPELVALPSPTKRFCTNCGTELSPNAKYCPSCGQKKEP